MDVPRLDIQVPESELVHCIELAFQALGYQSCSDDQRLVLVELVVGKDVFVVLPTGSGKSLFFVSLPLVFEHIRSSYTSLACAKLVSPIVIVVTPLISLMKDQVKKYRGKGVKCAFIGEELDSKEEDQILKGQFHVIYSSPESLLTTDKWRNMLRSKVYSDNLVGLIVDEAHCIHSW